MTERSSLWDQPPRKIGGRQTNGPLSFLLPFFRSCVEVLLCAACTGSYAVGNGRLGSSRERRQRPSPSHGELPAVTVLKPAVRGAEPGLEDNLRSYFEQAYPHVQLVFGVLEPHDAGGWRWCSACWRSGSRGADAPGGGGNRAPYGSNLKVSNLINMVRMRATTCWSSPTAIFTCSPPTCAAPVPALADPQLGLVTCLYYGIPRGGFWSQVGVLFIDEWFAPSVRIAQRLGSGAFRLRRHHCAAPRRPRQRWRFCGAQQPPGG